MKLGDAITYTQATPALANPDAPAQPCRACPYTAEVVEIGEYSVFVRNGGWFSASPLMVVSLSDIMSIDRQTSREQHEPSSAMPLEGSTMDEKADRTQGGES